ncbi:MAG: DUF86 domain-containing protein [Tissierellia bacterium]|nr:DUF86 domain-containing protein [Tissierellia bacterium]
MANDILLNKISIIERCINRVDEVYANNPENLRNYTKQDSIILNIQRAIEATIDIAMYLVSEGKLGLPQSSRDAFELLYENGKIDRDMLIKVNSMIGFRNIAVHNYQKINLNILQNIIENNLKDFNEFVDNII